MKRAFGFARAGSSSAAACTFGWPPSLVPSGAVTKSNPEDRLCLLTATLVLGDGGSHIVSALLPS